MSEKTQGSPIYKSNPAHAEKMRKKLTHHYAITKALFLQHKSEAERMKQVAVDVAHKYMQLKEHYDALKEKMSRMQTHLHVQMKSSSDDDADYYESDSSRESHKDKEFDSSDEDIQTYHTLKKKVASEDSTDYDQIIKDIEEEIAAGKHSHYKDSSAEEFE